ncbi:MAG: SUMF1/EgtB/PvdO family nonheme iron enzyme [Deltaproteobacteria bacterium]|nr:SUMF1/EgtB/PvdO family nonheme iron enzyme [Deltaproteobacteria bacterium]
MEENYIAYPAPAVTEGNRYAPNPFGLYNMAGNLKEWCLDWYDPKFYQKCVDEGIVHNPVNLDGEDAPPAAQLAWGTDGDVRAIRGSAWNYPIVRTFSAARLPDFPLRANDHWGFRIAFVL